MRPARLLLASTLLCSSSFPFVYLTARAQLSESTILTLQGAEAIAQTAQEAAMSKGARVVIVVVDAAGVPILLRRLDDTQIASVQVAIDKARTAAIYRRPSKVFEDQIRNGRIAALALHGAAPLQGGVPIVVDGKVVGAIGVSGETPELDESIAVLGAEVAGSFRAPSQPTACQSMSEAGTPRKPNKSHHMK